MVLYIPLTIMVLGFAFILLMIGQNLTGRFSLLRPLFSFTALWIVVAGLSMGFVFIDEEKSELSAVAYDQLTSHMLAGYEGAFWTAFTLTAFYMVGFLVIMIRVFMMGKKPQNELEWNGMD